MSFEKEHFGVIICEHVAQGAPVLFVAHDEQNDWSFLCGSDNHGDGGKETAHVAGLNHLIEKDPTLEEIESLPVGRHAERKAIEETWIKAMTLDK